MLQGFIVRVNAHVTNKTVPLPSRAKSRIASVHKVKAKMLVSTPLALSSEAASANRTFRHCELEPLSGLDQVDSTGSGVLAVTLGVKQDLST